MGLFDKLFPRKGAPVAGTAFETLTAYQPSFRRWNGRLYESETVRAALDARARHISKLEVDFVGTAHPALRNSLKRAPNPFQTWSQFLYRLSVVNDMQGNAFLLPMFDTAGETSGLFVALPQSCELVEDRGRIYVRYHFANGNVGAVEYEKCGIMTKHQYEDDIFGTGNDALRQTMELIDMQRQGVSEGIRNSATFRFMARLSNFAKPSDLARERERFNNENLRGESGGLLLFPNTYDDIRQIQSAPFVQDAAQMNAIRESINTYFGVNDKVLKNEASGDELDAFFDGAIEPFCVQLSDVLTKMLYTTREVAFGNRAIVSANRLQYMGTANKINMARELGDRGVLMIDEIRELFNYPPLPDGAGQHAPIRGEYYMVDEGKEAGVDAEAE